MSLSNYPHGWSGGVVVKGVPTEIPHSGKVFWVNNSSVLAEGGIAGSNGNPGTYQKPFSTIDYAIGKCTASRGDIIYVMPGYTESITTNDQIDVDVAGVKIIGLGTGALRPTLTWNGTDATACVAMAAANTVLHNFLLVSSDAGDDITGMVRVEVDGVELSHVEQREGTGQPETTILCSDGVDDLYVHDCKGSSLTNGASANDAWLELNAASTGTNRIRIENNWVHGTYDQGCIWSADSTAAHADILIKGNTLINTASSLYAIDLTSGTNATGMIIDNRVETDAEGTSIRGGGATLVNNQWGLDNLQSFVPGQSKGAEHVSVAPAMTITSATADEVAVVSSGGPIVINSIVGVCTTLHEAEAAAVFDNIVTGSSGNLYAADQETALQDSSFEVGDYVVFESSGPSVVEAATAQTEDSKGLNWLVAASDTIDIEGGSSEAEGAAMLVINYTSLGGELEVEAV